ncbi:hypothetical protein DASC09_051970 [Saccharomycopsis crataegensis]|uniref:Velvet domain-containing protein n=1 Tax=Saccharomycopsis crataegensis TaxID=43959 RepID=A0AAV5QSL5_9ASCO|nr:hypothetical protein DASC09_051970 [Saccharomycopsis crataegensis]
MVNNKYSPFNGNVFSHRVDYNLQIVTQPCLVRTSGKEKRPVIPSPVLQLQVIDLVSHTDITVHSLANFFLKAELLDVKGSPVKDPGLLVGTTNVSGDFVKFNNQKYLLFNFSNLSIMVKGDYRLRFSLYEFNGFVPPQKLLYVKPITHLISDVFTCYSSRVFYSKEIVAKREAVVSNILEINNNQLSKSNNLLTDLPSNISVRRSRNNSNVSVNSRSPSPVPSSGVELKHHERPLDDRSRKRVSISLNDDDRDLLNYDKLQQAYLSDSNYPASPKRQRSPSISSYHGEEDDVPENVKLKDQSFNGFLEELNDFTNPFFDQNVDAKVVQPMTDYAMNPSFSLSGQNLNIAANNPSLPNIVVGPPNQGQWLGIDDHDLMDNRAILEEVNKSLSRPQSASHSVEDLASPSAEDNDFHQNLIPNLRINSREDDLVQLLNDPTTMDDANLERVLSNLSNPNNDYGSVYDRHDHGLGLTKVLSNNSISNQDLLSAAPAMDFAIDPLNPGYNELVSDNDVNDLYNELSRITSSKSYEGDNYDGKPQPFQFMLSSDEPENYFTQTINNFDQNLNTEKPVTPTISGSRPSAGANLEIQHVLQENVESTNKIGGFTLGQNDDLLNPCGNPRLGVGAQNENWWSDNSFRKSGND